MFAGILCESFHMFGNKAEIGTTWKASGRNMRRSKQQQIALSVCILQLTIDRHACREKITMTNVEKTGKKRGPVAGTEEARRGGEAVRKKYGREFYARIGKKGGDTVRREHGSEFYAEIGRKGGEQTKKRQGSDFYARIGRIGGQRNSARVAPDTSKK
jgi:uncharacterized protein